MDPRKRLLAAFVAAIVLVASGVLGYMWLAVWSYDDPIHIGSNADFTDANGVNSGSGTESDPFVIDDMRIRLTSYEAVGIYVKDTTAHFVIKNISVVKKLDWGGKILTDHTTGEGSGVRLVNVTNAAVENCELRSCDLTVSHCNNCTLGRNTLSECSFTIGSCRDIILESNSVEGNGGVNVEKCTRCRISNNSMEFKGLMFTGGPEDSGYLTVTADNKVAGADLLYFTNLVGLTLTNQSLGQLVLFNCSEVLLKNLSWSGGGQVLVSAHVKDMTVTDCSLPDVGQWFLSSCADFLIDSCALDERLVLANCIDFAITRCALVPQWHIGILLDTCHRFNITDNAFSGEAFEDVTGCWLSGCDNATLSRNVISNCSKGLTIYQSRDIMVFNNNFLENRKDASIYMPQTTHPRVYWDNGYPSGGNYWSNFSSQDAFRGVNQDIAGSDGILDDPYVVPGEGVTIPDRTDRYPLASPFLA